VERGIGINVKLNRIFIDDVEVNIYGISDDTCVFGEITVRLELIKVMYALMATLQVIGIAEEYGIWIHWCKT